MSRAPLRSLCFQALTRWDQKKALAESVIDQTAALHSLDGRDRAFLNTVVLGVLRNLLLLDHYISRLRKGKLSPSNRWILRLGLFQLFEMRVPDHAAVSETVALAKSPRERGLINAILRRAARERSQLQAELPSLPTSTRFSIPPFLVDKWTANFGQEHARFLCEWCNTPPPLYVRPNTLHPNATTTISAAAEPSPFDPRFYRVNELNANWIDHGLCYVQDPSTAIACDLLHASPHENILDACAAPGGKTSLLAAQMNNQGRIVACDSNQRRLQVLKTNLQRLEIKNTIPLPADWSNPQSIHHAELKQPFDAILIDAPCSNTGVMRRRVDVRWRLNQSSFTAMAKTQLRIAQNCVPLLRPGGKLVYSTCSIEPEENIDVVNQLLHHHPDLTLRESRQTLPFTDHVDGAYAALLTRA